MRKKKDISVTFFGVLLARDPVLGYHWTRFAKGADVILYQTGNGMWMSKMYFGPTGSGQVIFTERARSPQKALIKLEKKVETLVMDFAAAAAKHAHTLSLVIDGLVRGRPSPRPRRKR